MARREFSGTMAARALIAFMLICSLAAAGWASTAPEGDPAAAALADARDLSRSGDANGALDRLRRLRADFPKSPLVSDSLSLAVDIALGYGDRYLARYYQRKLVVTAGGSPAAFDASMLIADSEYRARSYLPALEYYAEAVDCWNRARHTSHDGRARFDLALLRAADLSFYQKRDADSARRFLRDVQRENLPSDEKKLYTTLRVRLLWKALTPRMLKVGDANISALLADGDDLWVGTWNGGLARYSVSSGESDPFPSPAFPRALEAADRRIWVGNAEGLAWFGKHTARWSWEEGFQGPPGRKVLAVRRAGDVLYAGTLGDGLFRLAGNGWETVGDGALPGSFINCLSCDARGGRLYIGTMNLGLVILDTASGDLTALSDLVPDFTPSNITTVISDAQGRVWIGTYGDGLYSWMPGETTVRAHRKATGELGDDWILASCETERAVYFGTFGGGVSAISKATGAWRRFGIAEGLSSMDIDAIAWRKPFLFFGTLGEGVCVYDEAADGANP